MPKYPNKVVYGNQVIIDISDTTAEAADVSSGKYFYTKAGVKTQGQATGAQAVSVVETPDSHGGTIVTVTAVDLTGDTVAPGNLAYGETAHDAVGNSIVGSMKPSLKPGILRPDAELVKTWSYDKSLVNDWDLSVPSWSTSAVTVKASEAESETYTLDYNTYNYYLLERMLTIPEYSISTKGKGRVEYHIASCAFELAEFPANSFCAIVDPTKKYTSRKAAFYGAGALYQSLYWSTASAMLLYNTSAYSTVQAVVAPSISSGKVTINTPNCTMRGSTSYFTQTYWEAITDIRYQWIAELYRAPKENLNLDGWGLFHQADHILECVNGTTHTLT